MQQTLSVTSQRVSCYPEDRSANEPVFDPAVHLNLTLPETVATLPSFETVPGHMGAPPPPQKDGHQTEMSRLAFTSHMQVLSPAGVRALRTVIDNHRDQIQGNARINRMIRGLAYSSKFIRDLQECPMLLNHLSKVAGTPVIPHYMHGSYAHTNISSDPKLNKAVDSWHVDSCPFVLITVASDMEGMVGGEIQAVKRKGLPAARELVASVGPDGVSSSDMMSANYVSQGCGIFMQGSEILHRVTPVKAAKEPRISVVWSFMPASAIYVDTTKVGSWLYGIDGSGKGFEESAFEYTRGRAQRAQKQMEFLVKYQKYTADRQALANALERTAKELQEAIKVLRGEQKDFLGFVRADGKYKDEVCTLSKRSEAKL